MGAIPKRVYKYRNWTDGDHKNVLIKNELYLSSPKLFDDPFDCRIPPNFSLLNKQEIDHYINDSLVKHVELNINNNIDFNKVIPEYEKRMENITSVQKDYEKDFFQYQDSYYGVLSLTKRWNSISMWSQYANSSKGICIGFDEELLRKSIQNTQSACRSVKYNKKFPKIKPVVYKNEKDPEIIERMFIRYFVKSKEWKNEKEYRIVTNFYPNIPDNKDRKLQFTNHTFSEVTLGINFPSSEKKEIIEICKLKKIKIFQAYKAEFKFKILREPIN